MRSLRLRVDLLIKSAWESKESSGRVVCPMEPSGSFDGRSTVSSLELVHVGEVFLLLGRVDVIADLDV